MRHRTVERIHKHHFSNVLAMYELNGIRMVRNDRTILSIDHLEIPTHELTLILGHNGSGKSTLASIISGLVKPDAGTTKLEGCDLFTLSERERAQRAAFLPQKLPASEGLTCRELVRLGRFPWRGLFAVLVSFTLTVAPTSGSPPDSDLTIPDTVLVCPYVETIPKPSNTITSNCLNFVHSH